MKAGPLRKCPKCGKVRLNRLIGSGAGVIFKGSGFYETDYRSESYKKGEKSEKSAGEKKTTAKDAGKKEPETKAKELKPSKKDKSNPTEKK
jgi:predicted nucleic acid-binding Zn ribbon protein